MSYTVRTQRKQECPQLGQRMRIHAEFRQFLLMNYFGMLVRIKMCRISIIRKCCIGLCTYF